MIQPTINSRIISDADSMGNVLSTRAKQIFT